MQNRYRKVFGNKKVLLPVIHAVSKEQVFRNIKVAKRAGADGVFLINHAVTEKKLVEIYELSRKAHPEWWIGLNSLGIPAHYAIKELPVSTSGIWVDDAEIDESLPDKGALARATWTVRAQRKEWLGLYFGGVAFKYQRSVSDLSGVSKEATKYMDVVTTSGDITGSPPSIEKIRTMREAIGDFPLAIASGMTPENVRLYEDFVDCFLVSTGISKSLEELDGEKIKNFIQAIR